MTTANATTNAIGHHVSSEGALGGLTCKTDQFKIDVACTGSSEFLPVDGFDCDGMVNLGDLMSDPNHDLQIIAQTLFENGTQLNSLVGVWRMKVKVKNLWEIRAKGIRYNCNNKRVYSKKL